MADVATYVEGPGRSYHGVIRDDNNEEVWRCKHYHSKPVFDVRYKKSDVVWEYSAMHCAQFALDTKKWEGKRSDGMHGLIAETQSIMSRQDTKTVKVYDLEFFGMARFDDAGERIIELFPFNGYSLKEPLATFYPDVSTPYKGLTFHGSYLESMIEPAQIALWALKRDLWGLIFRQSDEFIDYSDMRLVPHEAFEFFKQSSPRGRPRKKGKNRLVLPEMGNVRDDTGKEDAERKSPEKLSSKQSKQNSTSHSSGPPRISVATEGGKRVYEVIDEEGNVVERTPLRGLAFKRLDRMRKK